MKVAILGSRDQLCVNPAVMEAPTSREKLHMCQARVKARARTSPTEGRDTVQCRIASLTSCVIVIIAMRTLRGSA